MRKTNKYIMLTIGIIACALSSCSISRHLPDDSYLLDEVSLISEHDQRLASSLKPLVRQQPNTRTLGIIRLPLRIYSLSGVKDNYINRTLQKIGEKPQIYDESLTRKSCDRMEQALINQGYLKAKVSSSTTFHGHKAQVNYYINPQDRYQIATIDYQCADSSILNIIQKDEGNALVNEGETFNANKLDEERSRITELLQKNGYYTFKKDHITYLADTARNSNDINLHVRVRSSKVTYIDENTRQFTPIHPYKVTNVSFLMHPISSVSQQSITFADTLHHNGFHFLYNNDMLLRPSSLKNASMITPGTLYNISNVKDSYLSYGRLDALKYTNIQFVETSDTTLDCLIALHPTKKISVGGELDFTNTSGGYGVSAALSFTNRNLFRGSETFTIKGHGAYENIANLADYTSKTYKEFGIDMGISFPRFIVPFIKNETQRRSKATTQFDLQYNTQKRPEFDRDVFSASWGYLWNSNQQIRHRFDLLGINFVSVPRKDPKFINDYLNQYNSKNSILKFNYEDLFIFRSNYNFQYTSPNAGIAKDHFDISHSVRIGIESAGNLLYLISKGMNMRTDSLGQYRIFNLAYAQYLKNDFQWTMEMNFNQYNSLLFHIETGVAFPYGNARMLPFEKRYYAGGAYGVRGWSVRELGPGSYVNRNNTIDYINHSGDIKLDLSLEYRMHLFWKFNGALFIDAGNIWTMYDYDDQPGGVFQWDNFYNQIAVAYGTGIRVDLNFLILRFDIAMKAINPAFEGRDHYPILNPSLKRDFAWHFAVGYPF